MTPLEDTVNPPRRRSLAFYLVFLFAVLPVWGSVPLSWAFSLWASYTGKLFVFGGFGRTLFIWSIAEVLFSIYYYSLYKSLSRATPLPPEDMHELQITFQRVLKSGLANLEVDEETLANEDRPSSPEEDIIQLTHDDPRAVDFRNSLRTWFGKCAWSSVRLRQVHQWLYWSMFNATLPADEEIPPSRRKFLDEAVDLLEKRLGSKIPPGNAQEVTPLLLTLDYLNVRLRPLWFYTVVAFGNRCLKYYMHANGARYHRFGGLEYLLRTPREWDPTSKVRPVVFIHGLGLGLLQYVAFLWHLLSTVQDRPVLVLLQPHISQDFFHPNFFSSLPRKETGRDLVKLMSKLGWIKRSGEKSSKEDNFNEILSDKRSGVTMISHSNGSYTHAWICKDYRSIIHRSAFIDPTCFCLAEGDVCYKFLYSRPSSPLELIMRYFVATELGVANLLQRNFRWNANCLWQEEIPHARDPKKALFCVAGKDDIVNAERVKKYLTSHGIKKGLIYNENGRHGSALIVNGEVHKRILRWLQEDNTCKN